MSGFRVVSSDVLLRARRMPRVAFFTSNQSKFSQAKVFLEAHGAQLSFLPTDSLAYPENYAGTAEDLLYEAVERVRARTSTAATFFFIEDTTVRIEALSTYGEFPGLATKEWFDSTSFDELDAALRLRDNDRRCAVRSSIALSVPGVLQPRLLIGVTAGLVADAPSSASGSVFTPWLDPRSFSGWFIPDGATTALAEMSFEESLEYDFRIRAFRQVLDRVIEYTAVLNAPASIYFVKSGAEAQQPTLFNTSPKLLVVIGPTCAGKTTFGLRSQTHADYSFIDASSIVKLLQHNANKGSDSVHDFARSILAETPDVVARYLLSNVLPDVTRPLVVTGLRTLEELDLICGAYDNVKIVYINAPQRLRYERHVRRNSREVLSYAQFCSLDDRQHEYGLLPVARLLADVVVTNEYDELELARQIDTVVGVRTGRVRGVARPPLPSVSRAASLCEALAVMSEHSPARSGASICEAVNVSRSGPPMTLDWLTRSFARHPGLVSRVTGRNGAFYYTRTSAGGAFMRLAERRNSR